MLCALCGHEEETLVTHIREKHDLKTYMNLFPDLPVVSRELYTAIENAVYFGYADDTPGLKDISPTDREMLLINARNNQHPRSDILVTSDF